MQQQQRDATKAEWTAFLEEGRVADDAILESLKAGADSIVIDDDCSIVRNRAQFTRLMRIHYPTESSLTLQANMLLAGWRQRNAFSPKPTGGQKAWIRWFIYNDVRLAESNRAEARHFLRDMDSQASMDMRQRAFLDVIFANSASDRDSGAFDDNVGESLALFMEADRARRKAFVRKVARYKHSVQMDPRDIPDMTVPEEQVAGDKDEMDRRRAWTAQLKLEQQIREDPYLNDVLGAKKRGSKGVYRKVFQEEFVGALKNARPRAPTDAEIEESRGFRKARKMDIISTGTTARELLYAEAKGLPLIPLYPQEVGAERVVRFGKGIF